MIKLNHILQVKGGEGHLILSTKGDYRESVLFQIPWTSYLFETHGRRSFTTNARIMAPPEKTVGLLAICIDMKKGGKSADDSLLWFIVPVISENGDSPKRGFRIHLDWPQLEGVSWEIAPDTPRHLKVKVGDRVYTTAREFHGEPEAIYVPSADLLFRGVAGLVPWEEIDRAAETAAAKRLLEEQLEQAQEMNRELNVQLDQNGATLVILEAELAQAEVEIRRWQWVVNAMRELLKMGWWKRTFKSRRWFKKRKKQVLKPDFIDEVEGCSG